MVETGGLCRLRSTQNSSLFDESLSWAVLTVIPSKRRGAISVSFKKFAEGFPICVICPHARYFVNEALFLRHKAVFLRLEHSLGTLALKVKNPNLG